jgi:hypothetical protein
MSNSNLLSVSLIAIFILITTINVYPRGNSFYFQTEMCIENKIDTTQNSFIDTAGTEEVSIAGATIFSLFFPGAGLYLTEDYLPGTLYLFFGTGAYAATFAILASSNEVHIDDGGAVIFLVTAGIIHTASILHTLLATIEYNESIAPLVTYGGKNVQFGLSIKL